MPLCIGEAHENSFFQSKPISKIVYSNTPYQNYKLTYLVASLLRAIKVMLVVLYFTYKEEGDGPAGG